MMEQVSTFFYQSTTDKDGTFNYAKCILSFTGKCSSRNKKNG
jgi:hypothetical protein